MTTSTINIETVKEYNPIELTKEIKGVQKSVALDQLSKNSDGVKFGHLTVSTTYYSGEFLISYNWTQNGRWYKCISIGERGKVTEETNL